MALEVQFQFQQAISELQKLNSGFETLSRSLLQGHKELTKVADGVGAIGKEATKTERALSNLAKVRLSFSASNLKDFSNSLSSIRAELDAISASNKQKLGPLSTSLFVGNLTETKAQLELQNRLNAEIEKQAKLTADIAKLQGSGANRNLVTDVENLAKAEAATARLIARKKELLAVEERLYESASRVSNSQALLRQGAYQSQINVEQRSFSGQDSLKQGSYQAQINAEEKLAKARAALAQGANQALINSEEKLARVRESLKQGSYQAQINKEAAAFASQEAALSKLGSRLNSLKGSMPTSEFIAMKQAIHAMNIELAKTGKVDKLGIASLSAQIYGVDKSLKQNVGSFNSWGKSAKFAIGGVARSFGAMTYSYTMLAPLLAGMAVGAAVKEVYELGSAMEYSATYAVALADSLKGISPERASEEVAKLTDAVLSLEGLRQGPDALMKGLLEVERAGLSAHEMMKDLGNGTSDFTELSKFAALAEMDMAEAIKAVVGQHYAFGESITSIANKITVAASESATDIKSMSSAFAYTTELATVSKVQFSELATAMALMANKGIEGTKAGTALRTAILRMQKPSEKLKGMLSDLGLSFSAFTEGGQVKSLKGMIANLKEVTENLPEPQRIAVMAELFGLRELKAGAVLLDSYGEKWDKMWEKVEGANGNVTEIQRLNDALANTAEVLKDVLAASYKQSLAKAYDAEPVSQMLRDLDTVVKSDAFVDAFSAMTSAVNFLGTAATNTLVKLTELYAVLKTPPTKAKEFGAKAADSIFDFLFGPIDDYDEKLKKYEAQQKEFRRLQKVNLIKEAQAAHDKNAANNVASISEGETKFRFMDSRMSADQKKQYDIIKREAEVAARTIDRIFSEISPEIGKPGMSKFDQQLLSIKKKFEEAISNNASLEGVGDKALESLMSKAEDKLTMSFLSDVQEEVDKLSFSNLVSEAELAGNASEVMRLKVMQTLKDIQKYSHDINQLVQDPDTGEFSTTSVMAGYTEAQLNAIGVYTDKVKQAQVATSLLGNEIRKLGEVEFGPDLSKFNEQLKSAGGFANMPVLDEWDKKLVDIDNKVKAISETPVMLNFAMQDEVAASELLRKFKEDLVWIEKYKGFQDMQKRINELDFSIVIGGLERARRDTDKFGNMADKASAEYKKLEREAYQRLNGMGEAFQGLNGKITFGQHGIKEFDKMIKASNLFKESIREIEQEMRKLDRDAKDRNRNINDALFEVRTAGMSEVAKNNKKYLYDMERIKVLEAEARLEAKKGIEGEIRARELLNEVVSRASSVELYGTDGKLLQGRKEQVEQHLLYAKKFANELDAAQRKSGEMAKSEIESSKRSHDQRVADTKDVYAAASGSAKEYQTVIAKNMEGTIVWTKLTVASAEEAAKAWDKVAEAVAKSNPNSQAIDPRAAAAKNAFFGTKTDTSKPTDLSNYQAAQEAAIRYIDSLKRQSEVALGDQKIAILNKVDETERALVEARAAQNTQVGLETIEKLRQAAQANEVDRLAALSNLKAAQESATKLEAAAADPKNEERRLELLQQAEALRKAAIGYAIKEAELEEKIKQQLEAAKKSQEAIKTSSSEAADSAKKQAEAASGVGEETKIAAESVKESYGIIRTAAGDYKLAIESNKDATGAWAVESVKNIDSVNEALEKLKKTADSIKLPSSSGISGARAEGGPVSAGKTYLVGEKGMELFSPTRSGFIIPNDKLHSSRSTVDINLSVNNSEPVQLQGTPMAVEKLERAFRDNRRYAS